MSGVKWGIVVSCASLALVAGRSSASAQGSSSGQTPSPGERPPAESGSATGSGSGQVGTTATSTATEAATLYAAAGRDYYRAGQYLEAAEQFQRAFALLPTSALAFNIARSYERLSQWQDAIDWYERYVTMATDARDKAEALEKIELLRQRLQPDATTPETRYAARLAAGRQAYSRGDFEAAIEEFKAAFDIKASPGALYNIAKSYEKLGRYEESIDYFTQYLELDPNATDRTDVEETIKRLRASIRSRFQELSVSSDPPGADIYLDDRNTGLQGQTNFQFKLTPGRHTLFIDLNGYTPIEREFVMPEDKPLALDFKLSKLENVGFLDINVDREGARIFVDGAIVGLSPYKQKKQVVAGPHQITVELIGYNRWTGDVNVARDETKTVSIELEKYSPPVADDTLSAWGRNLMLIGIIGGALGFGGPWIFQEFIEGRPYYEQLGPETVDGSPFYRGPLGDGDPNRNSNGEFEALRLTQIISLITGATLTAGGLAFFMYKWFRTVPPPPVTSRLDPALAPGLRLDGLGVVPTADGAAIGIKGSF